MTLHLGFHGAAGTVAGSRHLLIADGTRVLVDVGMFQGLKELRERVLGRRLLAVRLRSPFVLRTVDPSLRQAEGLSVIELRRLGKRIVAGLEGGLFLVMHLMIAGRLHWKPAGAKNPGKLGLAAFDFETGTLLLTDAGSKRRASLHLVRGEESLRSFERGGLELRDADPAAFRRTLASENHTTTGPPPSKSWRRTRRAHEFRYDTCTVRRRARA